MYVEPVLFLLSADFYFKLWGWCACGIVEGRLWVVVPAVAHGSGCGSLRERHGYGGRASDVGFCPLVFAIDEDGEVVELVALDLELACCACEGDDGFAVYDAGREWCGHFGL